MQATDLPSAPADIPLVATDIPVVPTDVPVVPTDVPVVPTDVPVVPTDRPVVPIDRPVVIVDAGCVAVPENTNPTCSDGRDNDCDGVVDCNDSDCLRAVSVTVCTVDGGPPRDVVLPRDVIYRDVPRVDVAGCVRTGDEFTLLACGDGRDNDCDGFVDCDDRNCSCRGACGAAVLGCTCQAPENANPLCDNGIDDDCNGFTDCSDFGCSRNPMILVCTP